MDVDRWAASTLAFCTISGLKLIVMFCFFLVVAGIILVYRHTYGTCYTYYT